jgi:hypothetical protein
MKQLILLTYLLAAIALVSCQGNRSGFHEGRVGVVGKTYQIRYEASSGSFGKSFCVRFKNSTGGWQTEYAMVRWETVITLGEMDYAKLTVIRASDDPSEITASIFVNGVLCKSEVSSDPIVSVDCLPMTCD